MNEENEKLAKIKKSSRVGKKVTNILALIVGIVSIIMIVTGIIFLASGDKLESKFAEAAASGVISEPSNKMFYASAFHVEMIDPTKIETSSPALKHALETRPYTITYGIYFILVGLGLAGATVLLKLLSSGFAIIEKEDNPFTPAVIKRVTIVLIVLSIVMGLTIGGAYVVIGLLSTWLIHSVMEYGRTLQIQSDETL